MRYPLGEYEKDKITSKTGKRLEDINLEEVLRRINTLFEEVKVIKKLKV